MMKCWKNCVECWPARTHLRYADRRGGRPSVQHGVQSSFRQFGVRVPVDRLRPGIDYSFIEINRKLRKEHPEIVASVIRRIEGPGRNVASWDEKTQLLHLNNELRVSIVLCRHWHHERRFIDGGW
jgi:hypothetical protein